MNSADNTVPPVLLCTERLTVRRVCVADYREMFRWSGDERVYRYLLANACKTPEDILPWLQRQDPEAEDRLVCILHGRSDSRPVGVVAFFFDAESDTWSFAYSLAYEEWGKGYATEATRAMMDYVRQTYGAHRFEAECATENSGSARVMEKCGLSFAEKSSYTKHDGSKTFSSHIYRLEEGRKTKQQDR